MIATFVIDYSFFGIHYHVEYPDWFVPVVLVLLVVGVALWLVRSPR